MSTPPCRPRPCWTWTAGPSAAPGLRWARWRIDPGGSSAAEDRLAGIGASDRDALRSAIEASFAEARPLAHNAYKIPLARNAALRVIETAARMPS